ncbi:hypothetical protein KKB55_06520 [Myxococcota bacterium]|nr:hypothetical protein [Myxococcota bacterium]MBU1897408.1 hypothetical protein [Myxococcota bacterium]
MKLSQAYLWLSVGALMFAFGCEVNVNEDENETGVAGTGGTGNDGTGNVGGGFSGFDASTGNVGGGGEGTGNTGGGGTGNTGGGGDEPPDGCDAIPATRNMGAECTSPADCGEGGVCTGDGASVCYQKCIPGECTDMCAGTQSCMALTDANGQPIVEGGKPVGYCAAQATGDDCVGVMECIFECEDSACAQACYANGTPAAAAEANELIACIQANYDLCETDACFEDACAETWHCMPEGGSAPSGDQDCNTSWFCILGCDSDDAACQQDCVNNATADAYSQLMDVFDCAQTAPGETWHSVADYCAEEWAACDLPAIGNGTCADFFNCFIECETDRCAIECMLSVSEEAIGQYNDMIDCADQAGILDNPQATFGDIAEGCPEAWATCGLDPIEYGDATCSDIIVCMDGCGEDQACYEACFNSGSQEGQTGYSGAVSCIMEAECNAEAQTAAELFNAETCPDCAEAIGVCTGM